MTDRAWQHPWLRIRRLIRSILEMRRDPIAHPVMKATLTKAIRERERIRRAGWVELTGRHGLRRSLARQLDVSGKAGPSHYRGGD